MKQEKRFDPEAGFITCDQYIERYLSMLPNVDLLQEQWERLPDENEHIFYLLKPYFDDLWENRDLEKFGIDENNAFNIREIDPNNQYARSISNTYLFGIVFWE